MNANGTRSSLRRAFLQFRGGKRLQGFDDEHSARSFHLLLTVFLVWVAIYGVILVGFFAVRRTTAACLFLVLFTAGLTSLVLLRRGRSRAAGFVFVTLLWSVFAVASLLRGGIHGGLAGSAGSAVILSAWLLGRAPTVGFLSATLLLGFTEALLERLGHAFPDYFPGEPLTVWMIGSGILLITVAPVIFALENLRMQIAARRNIEKRDRLLVHALHSAADCVVITDIEGLILYVNDAALRTYGYRQQELLGQPIEILNSTKNSPEPDAAASAQAAIDTWRGERWNRTRQGREFAVALATSVVRDQEGREIARVSISQDITEQKRTQAEIVRVQAQLHQANKMESIGRLAGGVAHDFNNLLTVIRGYAGTVLTKLAVTTAALDPAIKEGLGHIALASDRAIALARHLLTFSRDGASSPRTMPLNALVLGIEDMLRRLIGERVRLVVTPGAEAGFIHADTGRIEQIIVNLTVNAVDAMPEGGELYIETSCVRIYSEFEVQCLSAPRGAYVSLQVTDTGSGMTPEIQARMFDPFFTTKEVGKGTGLGLSTVYGIVKQSGGYISFHSTSGLGTTFRVLFPMVEEEAVAEAPPLEIFSPDATETVLLVEDDAAVRTFIRGILSEQGYRVLDVADSLQAIELAERYSGRIHLLLTDVVLPGMNGEELIQRISALLPGIPVLRMSGYPERSGMQLKTGTPYLQKPFSPAVLLNRIRTVL